MSNATDGLPKVTVAILAYNCREALAVNLAKVSSELDYPRDRLRKDSARRTAFGIGVAMKTG